MTDNSIFEILTQLENDLKDIKAAKEQIDDVVQADSIINENLADYTKQLASIATQLGSLKEFIKSEVKGIASDVDSDVTERLASVSKLISNIGKLSSEIESNAQKVVSNTTEVMNDSCLKVIKNFEASTNYTSELFSKQTSGSADKLLQAAMDLNDSVTDFSCLKKEILQKSDALSEDISSLKVVTDNIAKVISSLVTENALQNKNLQTINENNNQILIVLKNHEDSLQSAIMTIEEKNDKVKEELKTDIDTNKKILFAAIVLIVIDIIMRFI